MNWSNFGIRVPGKWVLSGEHSVLRGATAIALPHPSLSLGLTFTQDAHHSGLEVEPPKAGGVIHDLLRSIADQWEDDGRVFVPPTGKLKIESDIPIGAGFGSSAALCVGLTHWLEEPLKIPSNEAVSFATQLEHRFHGRSSGMDVAVISANEPITFVMGRGPKPLGIKNLPKFTFHDTGLRARTNECVFQVEKFREENPALAVQVDEKMGTASRYAVEGLVQFDAGLSKEGLSLLQKSMNLSRECFYEWRLVPGEAKRIEEDLLKKGALAVKLTGAGGGGMVVALWS